MVHVAITRQVREGHVAEFERALAEFARASLAEPGARGVHCLHPAAGSGSREYGILRSFASPEERDAFYESKLYRDWLATVEPLVEGECKRRELHGLEAWFREGEAKPPRWKMALLTWVAVWPVSMFVPKAIVPWLGPILPQVLLSGVVAAGIVTVLTWAAMPLLVKLAHRWLHPS